jgi:hypothetical protein
MARSRTVHFAFLSLFLALAAVGARAQTITMGNLPPGPYFGFNPGTITAVDLSAPANASGSIDSATFAYSVAPCAASVKIKFFRPSGSNLVFLAERGPFDVTSLQQTVPIDPVVPVEAGDLVGIARVSTCGSPVGQSPGNPGGFLAFASDVTSDVPLAAGAQLPNMTISVRGTGTAAGGQTTEVIPVVISSPGVPPSLFKTSVQLTNPGNTPISGKLVFHPGNIPGSASDPSLSYALAAGQTQTISDLLTSIGQTGIGSVDVVPETGSAPVALVRVYNDAGPAGTSGFTEDPVKVGNALKAGDRGVLIAPFDVSLFRFNVGVRTLGVAATMTVTVKDANGVVRHTIEKTYTANFFTQSEGGAFAGIALGASDTLSFDVTAGSVIVYGATADNRTQDPSVQIARRFP